jgi:hypothetical protein
MNVAELRRKLSEIPEEAHVIAYEGEQTGISFLWEDERGDGYRFIETPDLLGPRPRAARRTQDS